MLPDYLISRRFISTRRSDGECTGSSAVSAGFDCGGICAFTSTAGSMTSDPSRTKLSPYSNEWVERLSPITMVLTSGGTFCDSMSNCRLRFTERPLSFRRESIIWRFGRSTVVPSLSVSIVVVTFIPPVVAVPSVCKVDECHTRCSGLQNELVRTQPP